MDLDKFSPDDWVFLEWGSFQLNATIVFTWVVMTVLVVVSWLVTRRLSSEKRMSRSQNVLEMLVAMLRREIGSLSNQNPDLYLPFVGTFFVFIAAASILSILPGFAVPTASITTTLALAVCVLVGVPVFGIRNVGFAAYMKNYVRPTPVMLPFNIIGEITRTAALAIRLFGNMFGGVKIIAVLAVVAPVGPPVIMNAFGLLIGMIQAYIFLVLAMVYIASGMQREQQMKREIAQKEKVEQMKAPDSERSEQ